jgi:UDP-N-acetylmuramoyl-L-alanyl-D-glutamate--2,6-diaminopimelate ligase
MEVSDLKDILPGCIIEGKERSLGYPRIDSRSVKNGDTFIAVKGSDADGHKFIPDAIKNGAHVVICNKEFFTTKNVFPAVTFVKVDDTKKALNALLPLCYPGVKDITLIGITGTSGKTTITYIMEAILKSTGKTPGVIGTIETRYKTHVIPAVLTTPSPVDLFETLQVMRKAGVDTCVMEVSSHALHQDRISPLKFDYAVFINLSQDHLDYHKDMESYFLSKRKLFTHYVGGKAIINIDDPYGDRLAKEIDSSITFGRKDAAMVKLCSLDVGFDGISLELKTPRGMLHIKSPLLGEVQAYNIMACVCVALAMGIKDDGIVRGISSLKKVLGRVDFVENPYDLKILVDYAHKPEALSKAIETARGLTKGKVVVVFGCGGDRDRLKRPKMGRIAVDLADLVIITSDNPRTEEPNAIINEILSGIEKGKSVIVEPDRRKAIMQGIKSISKDDCLLIAGKGHEQYQIIGTKKYPFDDKEVALESMREIFGS